jgi:NDP-4-keto-2,6-dideoxyhexose 3-C-methyltransferase
MTAFETVLDLGEQYLTGVFPKTKESQTLSKGPLHLVRCCETDGCGLVQLSSSFDPSEMYGDNYGYRSGLNPSMVRHLKSRADKITRRISLADSDVVMDIGSNDGTTLGFYSGHLTRVGIDPTAQKFRHFYPSDCLVAAEFFTADLALSITNGRQAKVISAFSMMYDLEQPVDFVKQVARVLDADGIFVFEQSYLPLMLERTAFDTICHEHLEYYAMRQIDWILRAAGLEAIDVELNDVNGGSFAVTAAHDSRFMPSEKVAELRRSEERLWSDPRTPLGKFSKQSREAIRALQEFVTAQRAKGNRIAGLGASTKGNVLLQAAELGPEYISVIGDVNPDKEGRVTPGSWIPIVSEADALAGNFDYYLVLPWHFKEFFLQSPVFTGRRLVFPLPKLAVQ